MILIDLYGSPGSGKTTISYYLAYRLKKAGFRTELVGESAREYHIYDSTPGTVAPPLLDNQVLLAGQTYERILRLARHGFECAVSDSPLIQGLLYCEEHFYYNKLHDLMRLLESQFATYRIFIQPRPNSYDPESRVQRTEAEVRAMDSTVRRLAQNAFWKEVKWSETEALGDAVVRLAKKQFPRKKKA